MKQDDYFRVIEKEKRKEELKRLEQQRLEEEEKRLKDQENKNGKDKEEIDSDSKDKEKSALDQKSVKVDLDDGRSTKGRQTKKGGKKEIQYDKALEALKPEQLVEKEIGKPYFIVPDETKLEINKELIEMEDNKVRRWKVFINEIRLENLQKEVLSVFLNFRIGQIGKTANKYADVSSGEVFFKSEICKELKRSEVRVIKVMFETEMHLSYQMLKERYFVIEVWEYRRFRLNLFLGKIQVSLLSIASGNIKRQDDIKKAFGERRQFARIYYNVLFQEIWDYKLTFEAWKGSNIIADGGEEHDPKIQLTLMTEELIQPQVESEQIKKTKNPNFKNLKGYMHYRGTMEDLTQQMMKVTLLFDAYFNKTEKLVSLRGIQDTNYLKVQFRLKLKKPPPRVKIQKKKKKNNKQKQKWDGNDEDEDEDLENDEDALRDEAYIAVIEGRVNLNKQPRYSQNGELNTYIPEQYYLVVTINRLNSVLSPDDRGVINTFLTVAWRDQAKTTRMIKNDPNPSYNEELYFRIPILRREKTFDDIINQKTDNDLLIDALREEFKTRPDITIQLWLDGQDILSDESLGYVRIFLSEIQRASKFKKTLLTDDNRRYQFDTREQTFTKKFESGLFNVSHIQITFQVFFAPDLPDDLNLEEFCEVPDDIFPYQISDQLQVKKDHEENEEYIQWDKDVRQNFSQIGLEKTAYNIFFKNIFVRDQFNYYHIVCKYLEKFYIKFQSEEATQELFANPKDIRMKNLHEMCHFVRNVPFIQDSFSRNDVWRSPDFLLKIRKGFIHDHAILGACLFMGYEREDKAMELKKANKIITEKEYQKYIPFENRVFVCLGTLKHNSAFHAWLMVYSADLSSVTFWDVQEDFHYELKGRVRRDKRAALRQFLYAEKPAQKKESAFKFGNNEKKKSKKQLMIEQAKKDLELQKQKELEKQRDRELREQQEQKEAEERRKKARMNARFTPDDDGGAEQLGEQAIGLDDVGRNNNQNIKLKNARQMGEIKEQRPRSSEQDESEKNSTIKPTKSVGPKKTFNNPIFAYRQDPGLSTITKKQQIEEEILKANPIAKFSKIDIFRDNNNSEVLDQIELPYQTIEIIFNNKNLFGNMANQNPKQIYYHLHESGTWAPFIKETVENTGEENAIEMSDDDDPNFKPDLEELKKELDQKDQEFLKKTWNRKLGAFYSAQILKEPIKKNRIKRLLEDIFMEVKQGVEKARGKSTLFTKWKHDLDGINKKMEQYLKILEYKTTNRAIKIVQQKQDDENVKWNQIYKSREYDMIIEQWKKEVKAMLPLNTHLCILPMRFNYTESEKIRSVIVENMDSFFMRKDNKIIFNLAGKIFNYPNRIVCVRLILGYSFCQNQDDIKKKDDSDDDEVENQEGDIDVEKEVLHDIDDNDDENVDLLKKKNGEIQQ